MKTIEDVVNELATTLITKNNAYGDAVAKPPVLCPTVSPTTAIAVRLSDKLARFAELFGSGKPDNGESLRDTALDAAGYFVLLVRQMDNTQQITEEIK